MKYFGLALIMAASFFAGTIFLRPTACGAACEPKIVSVSATAFRDSFTTSSGTVIDIRTAEEFASGHLAGSVNVDFYQTAAFLSYLDTLDKNQPYYIYCRTGNRSGQALEIMTQKGFTNVTNLSGGIVSWQSTGLPVTGN